MSDSAGKAKNDADQSIPWRDLMPHLSVVVVECTKGDPAHAFSTIQRQLRTTPRANERKRTSVVCAEEFDASSGGQMDGIGTLASTGIDQVFALIRRIDSTPAWIDLNANYVDISYELNLGIRRGKLIAVRIDSVSQTRFQNWLDKAPRPNLQRIAPHILEHAFLMGRAKGLWLRGATGRSTRRPDAKSSNGTYLQDTLDPFTDSGYSLGSALCEMPTDRATASLNGNVGATLRNAQLWHKPMENLGAFIEAVVEVFNQIDTATTNEERLITAFPELAREVADISEVFGAYDVAVIDLSQLPMVAVDDDHQDAARILHDAVLDVVEGSRSASFKLDVGMNGAVGGTLKVTPKAKPHGFYLDFGLAGEPSNLGAVRPVLDALSSVDSLTVFYESGHVYSSGRIHKRNSTIFPFQSWKFESFTNYNIEVEKPFGLQAANAIHASIGADGDDSLFAWVLDNFSDGWLICDDGSEESADFLQIDTEGTLRIIHVKAAKSNSLNRSVSSVAYETVASQASKNLIFMQKERLASYLEQTDREYKASWLDGEKIHTRDEFILMLRSLGETNSKEVVIVQPHITERRHKELRSEPPGERPSKDLLRLHRVETLLNSARSAIVQSNAELWVIGSRDA